MSSPSPEARPSVITVRSGPQGVTVTNHQGEQIHVSGSPGGGGFNPMQLQAAALGLCTSLGLRRRLADAETAPEASGFTLQVQGFRAKDAPPRLERLQMSFTLEGGSDDPARQAIVREALQHCTIANTLRLPTRIDTAVSAATIPGAAPAIAAGSSVASAPEPAGLDPSPLRTATPRVLIVGAGPTGLTAANLLGRYGIPVTLVEAKPTVNRRPRSTFVDDEFFRILGTIGLDHVVRGQSLGPATYEQYSPLGFLLSREEGQITSHNYPTRSAIFQPWFDQTLLDGLRRFEQVEVLMGHELVGFEDRGATVECTLRDPDGRTNVRSFRYVLAADGARSRIREALGIEFEAVTPLEARSLRVDVEGDPDKTLIMRSRPGFRRHASSFPAPNGRRYSFSIRPGEDAEALLSDASVRRLLGRFRDASDARIINKAVYTFRTRVAARFRKGNVFLLGDAAHVQPPAGSQGMNGGARDAHNLAWKIAAVVRGAADPALLDTYEEERYAAARSLVEKSGNYRRRRGIAGTVFHDLLFKLGEWLRPRPPIEAVLADAPHLRTGQATALKSGVLVGTPTHAPGEPLGRLLPNPWVASAGGIALLDTVLAHEFAVIGIAPSGPLPAALEDPRWGHLRANCVVLHRDEADASDATSVDRPGIVSARVLDDRLHRLWPACQDRWLVVRPDRVVAAVSDAAGLGRTLEALTGLLAGAATGSRTAKAA